jgi:arginase
MPRRYRARDVHAPPTRSLAVVGVPIDSLGTPGGTEGAPGALRQAGIVAELGARDAGDLAVRIVGTDRDPESGIVGYPSVVRTCEVVRDSVERLLCAGAFPVVLGGCCSLVPGVAAGLRRAHQGPAGLAYVDGHLDLYDGRTSPTGEAADMPVAVVAGHGDAKLGSLGEAPPLIPATGIALLAHRDSEEARSLRSIMPGQIGIGSSRDCADVLRSGPGRVGAETADRLGTDCGRFWLSIDVDVLSDEAFAATPVQQPGGLDRNELAELCRPLAQHPACIGLDVLCYDPDMDDDRRSGAHAVVELLGRILATTR